VEPPAEHVHWLFATGFLSLGLGLLGEAIVGPDVWRMRTWRAYLWPAITFGLGVFMWPVMVFFTNSTLHMLAHGAWAEAIMLAGAVELALVRGKLQSSWWGLAIAGGLLVSGVAFLVHEPNNWFFQRSSFLHHLLGWTLLVAAVFPLLRSMRPRSHVAAVGFALTFVVVAVMLYCDRDVAPVFGHISELAGTPHR
jgi:signal transduction histidine kinase